MKAGTELFDLIKSLDGAEKGYFKKHTLINSRSNSDANYLLLFDSIAGQAEYNEKELRLEFKHHAFAKQFPVAKLYLYNRILKALDAYHSSVFKEVQNHIHYGEILYYKKLYAQASKIFNKAKKICVHYDLHFYYQEILRWESNLAVAKYDLNWMDKIISESGSGMRLLQNSQQYTLLSMSIMTLINRYGSVRKKFLLNKLERLMKNPALQKESSAMGFTSKLYFFAIHAFYWYARENYPLSMKYFKSELVHFQNNPEKINVQFSAYIVCINNIIEMLTQDKSGYKEVPKYLEILKAETIRKKKPAQQALTFYLYNHNLLVYLQRTAQFDKAVELLPGILNDYPGYGKELNPYQKTILMIKISIIWFSVQQYSKCLQYLNVIRNELSFKIQPDVDIFLHLFYIIVHYEAGHYDLLPSLIRSADNFLRKQKSQSKFENTLLVFFKKYISKSKTEKTVSADGFAQLKNEVLALTKNPVEKHSFELFDFISFIESKIENKSFAEIIRAKAGL
jgi:hypothetical protein